MNYPSWVIAGDEGIYEQNMPWYSVIHEVAAKRKPKIVTEFGVRAGYSARTLHEACNPMIIGYEGDVDLDTKGWWNHAIKIVPNLQIMLANTLKLERIAPCDLVLVDADHSYEGACHELELAVNACDYVLVDDYNSLDVERAVSTLLEVYPAFEFIDLQFNRVAHIRKKS